MKRFLSVWFRYAVLSKLMLSLSVTLSALTGLLLSPSMCVSTLVPFVVSVFALSCGMCALNQFQERDTDALMKRTRNRPLPSGTMRPLHALCFSLVFITGGIAGLAVFTGTKTAGFGMCALIGYNGIYTCLKRRTAFAVVPGAFVGALPPLMGWSAGGGGLFDPRAVALSALFFTWQIPHFWLLLLTCGDEYVQAGLPSVTRLFSAEQMRRIIFVWVAATAAFCLLLPLFGLVSYPAGAWCCAFIAAALIGQYLRLFLVKEGGGVLRPRVVAMHLYLSLVMVLLSFDKLLHTMTSF